MNFATLPLGPQPPNEIYGIVEIPQGSSNKYEYRPELGVFVLDRVLYSPLFYPCEYGWIPETLSEDGDPLDVLILATHPTFPGCVLVARPVGALRMRDEKGVDHKVIAVSARDPRFDGMIALADLPPHRLTEVEHFFRVYKELEHKETEILGWLGREETGEVIMACHARALATRPARMRRRA